MMKKVDLCITLIREKGHREVRQNFQQNHGNEQKFTMKRQTKSGTVLPIRKLVTA